jgi:hypothetical protein
MVDAVKGKFVHAPRGNRLAIFLGVTAALVVAGKRASFWRLAARKRGPPCC